MITLQYLNFMRSYENQREKLEKLVEQSEKEIDRLNQQCVELENQNFALSKGLTTHQIVKSSGYEG